MEIPPNNFGEITGLLKALQNGSTVALEKLIRLVYAELQRQADRFLRKERNNHNLQTTALVLWRLGWVKPEFSEGAPL